MTTVGPKTMRVVCPSCMATVDTKVQLKTTTKTHAFAVLLCLCGCLCCAFIPYLVDSCKNADHYCPSCGAYIGTYKH